MKGNFGTFHDSRQEGESEKYRCLTTGLILTPLYILFSLIQMSRYWEELAGVTLEVTIVGGVATIVGGIATWLFPAVGVIAGTATIISGVVTIIGAVASYNVNATLAQCQQKYNQQMALHQQRVNSCFYVSRNETQLSTQEADSCQW